MVWVGQIKKGRSFSIIIDNKYKKSADTESELNSSIHEISNWFKSKAMKDDLKFKFNQN